MKSHLLLAASAVAILAAAASAEEVDAGKGMKCTTTEEGNQKKVICISGDHPGGQDGQGPHIVAPPGEGQDVDVQVFNDGKTERRVIVVRTKMMDGADTNKDGKVSRKEFLAHAEKHFTEMDKNGNGSLEGEELHPPMPPMPPGVPPLPPAPPAPPTPPTPPAAN